MTPLHTLGYMISATVFGAVSLLGIIVYGGPFSRGAAIFAAFLAMLSQLTAQDAHTSRRIFLVSLWSMYAAIMLWGLSFIQMAAGR